MQKEITEKVYEVKVDHLNHSYSQILYQIGGKINSAPWIEPLCIYSQVTYNCHSSIIKRC